MQLHLTILTGHILHFTSLFAYAQFKLSNGDHHNITTTKKRTSPYSYTVHLRPLASSLPPLTTTTEAPEDELDENPDFNPVVPGVYSTPRGSWSSSSCSSSPPRYSEGTEGAREGETRATKGGRRPERDQGLPSTTNCTGATAGG